MKTSAAPGSPTRRVAGWRHDRALRGVRRPFTADSPRSNMELRAWAGARSPRPGHVRRPGDWRWDDRDRRRTRCGQPGAPGGTRREGRLRVGHVVQIVEDGPRRSPLPPTARVPAGLRESRRASTTPRQCPAPHHAPPLPDPAVRPRRRGVEDRRALLLLGVVALRPDRGLPDRQAPPAHRATRGARAPPVPAHGPPRRRLPLLRRAWRRRAGGAHPGAHCRAVVRRGRRQLRAGRRVPP